MEKRFVITITAMAAALFIIIGSAITVHSAQAEKNIVTDKYYSQLENEYRSCVRDYLNGNGYKNAGVMVTYTVDAEGFRTYTVKLHHDRFERLDENEKNEVLAEIEALGFSDELCSFEAEIIK